VALVRTDVSEERNACIFRVTRISELGTTLAVSSNRRKVRHVLRLLVTTDIVPSTPILVTLTMQALRSFETSVPTRETRRNIPEDGILDSLINFRALYSRQQLQACKSVLSMMCLLCRSAFERVVFRLQQEQHCIMLSGFVPLGSAFTTPQQFQVHTPAYNSSEFSPLMADVWLLTQRSRVRFLALPDFLSSSGSGTGYTQTLCG
jgi:hypothetical protein